MTQKKPKRSGVFKRRYDRINFIAPYSLEECERRLMKLGDHKVLPRPLQTASPYFNVKIDSLSTDRRTFDIEYVFQRGYYLRSSYGNQARLTQTLASISGNIVAVNEHETQVEGVIKVTRQSNFWATLLLGWPVVLIIVLRRIPANQMIGCILIMLIISGAAVGLAVFSGESKYRQMWKIINDTIGPRYHYD